MKQFVVTSSMGKRLIAKGIVARPDVRAALAAGRVVIVAGSTNGYEAEEVLSAVGQAEGFSRQGFRRGAVTPPAFDTRSVRAEFPGDVVLVAGQWQRGRTIFDVADELSAGDVILKGANALDLEARRAALLIGHPEGGTSTPAIRAVAEGRATLIVPVGLEKRVPGPVPHPAVGSDRPTPDGPGMLALPGEVFTELDALALLTGARGLLLAGGGVYGAEGAVWIGLQGTDDEVRAAGELIGSVAGEPPCQP